MAIDLIQDLGAKSAMLDKAVTQFSARGKAYAQAEHDYRVALRKKDPRSQSRRVPGDYHFRYLPG